MRKFGLIGYPLSHSFSPAYFTEKFIREGLSNCGYIAYPLQNIEEVLALLAANPEVEGLNVTIPYKKAIIPYLHEGTDAVGKMAACNCIKIEGGRLTGHNTDVTGFEQSLLPYLAKAHSKALILGTGGAAAAVEYVLQKLTIDYLFVSRNQQDRKNCLTYADLTREIVMAHQLIINTTPLGMYPSVNACPDIPYQYLTTEHYLFDLVYNPLQTLFLQKGSERGAITKNGADMLLIQAEESWKIWNDE